MSSPSLSVSQNKNKLNLTLIHQFLTQTYWAKGRSLAEVKTSIDNCHCFGLYHGQEQIGFARVLTDSVAFAYLMDVFILPEYQGKGYSKVLLKAVFDEPNLQNVTWLLKTTDAHGLYQKFGFEALDDGDKFWRKVPS